MKRRIVTISREFGSGGRTIGKELAKKLGIACYDQELIEKVAQESGLSEQYIREQGEYTARGGWLASALAGRDASGRSMQDELWLVQRQVILDLAERESCVIVGRCADYILREEADCLTVFVHASLPKRAQRIVSQYGEREDAPEKRLRDKDKRRASYYQMYTNMTWGDVHNYQIALDSGELGIETCVRLLAELY